MWKDWFKPRPPKPKKRLPLNLQPYAASLALPSLVAGIDNIHYDVFLSLRFRELARRYLFQLIQQYSGLEQFFGREWKPLKAAETSEFKKQLLAILEAALNKAKAENNVELYILARIAVYKFLAAELLGQFSSLLLDLKDRMKQKGEYFDRSAEAHVLKSKLADAQANRRHVIREAARVLHHIFEELEESHLAPRRKALFGSESEPIHQMLRNRLVFIETGRDDFLYLEHYVLLAVRTGDPDHLFQIEQAFGELLKQHAFASREGEQYLEAQRLYGALEKSMHAKQAELAHARQEEKRMEVRLGRLGRFPWSLFIRQSPAHVNAQLQIAREKAARIEQELTPMKGHVEEDAQKLELLRETYEAQISDLLADPQNARQLFDVKIADDPDRVALRRYLLSEMYTIFKKRQALPHILASMEVRSIYRGYCPPINVIQLKKALVDRKEREKLEAVLKQFPAKNYSPDNIEEAADRVKRMGRAAAEAVLLQFAEDFFRKQRDLRDLAAISAIVEKINLGLDEKLLEVSRMNHTLYEFVLPDEERPREDRIIDHVIVKADVRDSTRLTKELFARGLNPATYFSQNFYEPVRKILDRYEAVKVFIEGDALILSIYETEANRGMARPVAKACCLAKGILELSRAYNERAVAQGLPRLELGVGVAYQNSAPSFWMDGESKIMISKAINLADRLSSCSKIARKLLPENSTPFNLFVVQSLPGEASKEAEEEFLVRYNINGIELNESGFDKLKEEISLEPMDLDLESPFEGKTARLHYGKLPVGSSLEKLVLREGRMAQVASEDFAPRGLTERRYFEVCVNSSLYELVEKKTSPPQAAS